VNRRNRAGRLAATNVRNDNPASPANTVVARNGGTPNSALLAVAAISTFGYR